MFLVRVVSSSIQPIALWLVITCIYWEPKYRDLYHQRLWHITETAVAISLTQQIVIECHMGEEYKGRYNLWVMFFFIFFKIFVVIYLFIYLFMAALGLCCCAPAFSSCGERGLFFVVVHGLLITVASLVAEHGL